MRNPERDCTNAFDEQFLSRFDEREAPSTTTAALAAGPWQVLPCGREWGCFREGEAEPEGVFQERSMALLLAAALPVSVGRGRFRVATEEGRFAISEHGNSVGRLRYRNEELLEVLGVLAELVSDPGCFAWLLEAAGAPVLERVGVMLDERARGGRT